MERRLVLASVVVPLSTPFAACLGVGTSHDEEKMESETPPDSKGDEAGTETPTDGESDFEIRFEEQEGDTGNRMRERVVIKTSPSRARIFVGTRSVTVLGTNTRSPASLSNPEVRSPWSVRERETALPSPTHRRTIVTPTSTNWYSRTERRRYASTTATVNASWRRPTKRNDESDTVQAVSSQTRIVRGL